MAKKATYRQEVKDMIKKAFLLGVGLTEITQEKINSITRRVEKDYKINRKEGKKFANDLMAESMKPLDTLRNEIRKQAKKAVGELGLATKSDLKDLEKRLRKRKR